MSELPPEIQEIADLVADEPRALQENFLYILCTMLVEDEQMVATAPNAAGPWLPLEFRGRRFRIARPADLDEEMEEMLRAEIRLFLRERGGVG